MVIFNKRGLKVKYLEYAVIILFLVQTSVLYCCVYMFTYFKIYFHLLKSFLGLGEPSSFYCETFHLD